MAAGDVNGDGLADIITGAGAGGGPQVKVYDGASFAAFESFYAFNRNFTGGVRVAAADINGDGLADIITGGRRRRPAGDRLRRLQLGRSGWLLRVRSHLQGRRLRGLSSVDLHDGRIPESSPCNCRMRLQFFVAVRYPETLHSSRAESPHLTACQGRNDRAIKTASCGSRGWCRAGSFAGRARVDRAALITQEIHRTHGLIDDETFQKMLGDDDEEP